MTSVTMNLSAGVKTVTSEPWKSLCAITSNGFINIAYGMLSSPEDASDVAQDVFLWLWENIGQFRFKSQFSTWLYRIVTNRCLNLKDQRQRRKTDPMEIDDSQPWVPLDTTTPESTVLQAEQREMLQQALASLKDDYRKILILREMQDPVL